MRVIEFLDTTLRDGEQTPGVNFSIKEKVHHRQAVGKMGDFCY
ncbi:Isopropylmalate/homocitrate/citramalate synthase [Streptococcus suis GZ1]|uniref:Isopropylmalate/homocitrate/citramalate synthase n=1 Tax=Streptococcus suis (strain GZ1) TaxID=423211 RepID=D5AK54_STRGZ|nr:Isopropylmalate/homocitrate/citramalate synthase [Streptococcus suis GZ1]